MHIYSTVLFFMVADCALGVWALLRRITHLSNNEPAAGAAPADKQLEPDSEPGTPGCLLAATRHSALEERFDEALYYLTNPHAATFPCSETADTDTDTDTDQGAQFS